MVSKTAPSERSRAAVPFAVNLLLAGGLFGLMVADLALHPSLSTSDLILWITGSWILRLLAAYFAVRRTPNLRSYLRAVWPLAATELLAAFWLARPGVAGMRWNWSVCAAGGWLSAGFLLSLCGLRLAVERADGAAKPMRGTGAALVAAGLAPGAFIVLFAFGMSQK